MRAASSASSRRAMAQASPRPRNHQARAVDAELVELAEPHRYLRMLRRRFDLPAQLVRQPDVVVVEQGDPSSPRQRDASVARGRPAGIVLARDAESLP